LVFTGNSNENESVHCREEGCIGKSTPVLHLSVTGYFMLTSYTQFSKD